MTLDSDVELQTILGRFLTLLVKRILSSAFIGPNQSCSWWGRQPIN